VGGLRDRRERCHLAARSRIPDCAERPCLHERLLADDEVAGRSQRILPNGGRLTGVLSDAEKFLETSPTIVRAEYADQVGISHHSGTEFSVARLWIRPGQIPRGHKVQLADGPTVEAYCAIDALGIPAMLDRDVVISSQDPHTGQPIRITVTNGQASWRPDEAVVVLGSGPSCGPSACQSCPYITFHSSSANAAAHLQATDLAGEILTQPQALAAGTLLFGDLLRPVVESANGASETGGPTTDHRQIAG
jgi:hypothetical protein